MKRARGLALLMLAAWIMPAAGQSCVPNSFPSLALGTYTGVQSAAGATSVTLTCQSGEGFTIGLSKGSGVSATTTIRKMTLGAATLNYQLFRDAARTLNWGDIGASDQYSGTGTGSVQSVTIYPLIPAGQFVAPGTYVDTIIASVVDNGTTTSRSITVTAVVQATCTLSATNLAFGTYNGVVNNSTSSLTISCTNSTTYNVGLNAGLATGATVTNRSMTGPLSALLNYKLFSNAGRTTNWGSTVGTDTLAGTGNGTPQPLTVYGQIPAAQIKRPGSYSDTITATITY